MFDDVFGQEPAVVCAGDFFACEPFVRACIFNGDCGLGRDGVRSVVLRPDAIPEAAAGSHANEVFEKVASQAGVTVQNMLAERGRTATLLGRLPKLDEIAEFAAFAASDRAGAMTGAIANLTCGSLVD